MSGTQRKTLFASGLILVLLTSLYVIWTLHTRASEESTPVAKLVVTNDKGYQQEYVEVKLTGFAPQESVTLWQTFPDFKVLPRGEVYTNSAGEAVTNLFMDSSLPVGTHALSGHGNASSALAIGSFDLIATIPTTSSEVSVVVTSTDNRQGSTVTVEGAGYQGSEPVSLWLTRPDGSVADLGIVRTDGGAFSHAFVPGIEDGEGTYYITGFGRTSQRTGIASFTLARADYMSEVGVATLDVEPAQVQQLDTIALTGHSFAPGEVVGLWLTLPDGSVVTLYEGVTTDGSFREQIYLPAVIPEGGLPAGHHEFSAYGHSSGKRAIVSLSCSLVTDCRVGSGTGSGNGWVLAAFFVGLAQSTLWGTV